MPGFTLVCSKSTLPGATRALLTLALLIAILKPHNVIADDCVKTFRWTEDPPYTFASTQAPGGVSGISADTVRAVLGRMGCDINYVDMPWARALRALEEGDIDIVSGAFDTPERREFAYYAEQGPSSPNVIFVRADDEQAMTWTRFSDLLASDARLGAQIDVNYGPEYQDALETGALDSQLSLLPNRRLLWQMLDRDRIDAVAANYETGLVEIADLGFQGRIVVTSIRLSSEPAYFMFSKVSVDEAFVTRFDDNYASIVQSGLFQSIVDRYTPTH